MADYDARIEKLRATPEYPAVLQTGDDLTTAAARLSNAETRRNEVARQQEDVRRAINEKMESAIGNFIVAGELPLPNTRARSQTEIQAQIQNATPDFIQGVMQTSLRELFDRRVQPSVDELGQMITRAVNSTPEQLVDEILEAAKKRGKDPLSKYPPDAVTGRPGGPGARMRLNIARQYATPIEQATLRASQEIEKKGISSYLMALVESNQAVPSKSYPALRNQADPAKVQLYEDRAAFIRNVMAETMSGRMLRATSQIIEQDFWSTHTKPTLCRSRALSMRLIQPDEHNLSPISRLTLRCKQRGTTS